MKVFIFAIFVASAIASPNNYHEQKPIFAHESMTELKSKPIIPIVKYELHSDNAGHYDVATQGGDGTSTSEKGALKQLSSSEMANTKSGSVSFTSPEGKTFALSYVADENGYRPVGDHLPTSPPIPEEIKKSLALPRDPNPDGPVEESHNDYAPALAAESGEKLPSYAIRVEPYKSVHMF